MKNKSVTRYFFKGCFAIECLNTFPWKEFFKMSNEIPWHSAILIVLILWDAGVFKTASHRPSHRVCHIPKVRTEIWICQIWWRHQMKTFSALLDLCVGISPVTGDFTAQRPVARSFDVFVDLRLNKRLSKQWWGWWFETPSRPLWRHCNEAIYWRDTRRIYHICRYMYLEISILIL